MDTEPTTPPPTPEPAAGPKLRVRLEVTLDEHFFLQIGGECPNIGIAEMVLHRALAHVQREQLVAQLAQQASPRIQLPGNNKPSLLRPFPGRG